MAATASHASASSPASVALLSPADLAASKRACLQLYLASLVPSASTSASDGREQLLLALKSDPRGAAALQNAILARKENADRYSPRKEIECVERIRRRWSRDVCARVEELSNEDIEGRRVDVSRWVGGAANGGAKIRLARRECRDETEEMAYTIPQLLGAIMSIRSPASSSFSGPSSNGYFRPSHPRASVPSWGSIPLDLRVPSRDELSAAMDDDMGPHTAQCGIDDDDTIDGSRASCVTPKNASDVSGHIANGRKQSSSLISANAGTLRSSSTTFLHSRLSGALTIRRSGRTTAAQKFLRRGSPHCEHRLPLWRLALGAGGDDVVAKREREARFDELVRRVDDIEYAWIDQAICGDVAKIADDGEYFIFAEQLRLLMLCFVRDEQVPGLCATLPHPLVAVNRKRHQQPHQQRAKKSTPSKSVTSLQASSPTPKSPTSAGPSVAAPVSPSKNVVSSSSRSPPVSSLSSSSVAAGSDASSSLVPPCGVLPFDGISSLAALVLYLTNDTCEAYFLFRALYARHAVHLHVISTSSSGSESLLQLCAAFEKMLQESEPRLFFHILHLGLQPLEICFEWIVRGFVGHLSAREVLNLWDRIIGHGSLLVLPAAAAAILVFRKTAILSAPSADVVREILSDICELKIVPLLQAFMS